MYKINDTDKNQTVVIKIGGSTLSSLSSLAEVIGDITALVNAGVRVALVHGGGPAISAALKQSGNQCHFVEGLRVTDEKVLSIAKHVLDELNHSIVEHLKMHGVPAFSINSTTTEYMTATKKFLALKSGSQMDIGYVGEISNVNEVAVKKLLAQNLVPVFASIAHGADGQLYNVNADNVAMALAVTLAADKLVYVTDVPGILLDQESVLREVNLDQIGVLIDSGIIKGGMIPKVRSCASGIRKGIGSIVIGKVNGPGSLLSAVYAPENYGTVIATAKLIA